MDQAQRQVMSQIVDTVSRWTGGKGDPRPLISFALRESALRPDAVGDASVGLKVFAKKKQDYVAHGNPYTSSPELWAGSRGIYQLMPGYHLFRWSWTASPAVLHDPRIATVVAARLFNRARQLGAKTVLDARMLWAYGPKGLDIPHDDERYTKRLASEQNRLASLGFPRELATTPISSLSLDAFGLAEQPGQDAKIGISDDIELHNDVQPPQNGLGWLGAAAILFFMLRGTA